ncbi:hypothetical protein [Methylobacterium brachiatum]
MRHPLVQAVLASPNVRDFVVPKLVEQCFAIFLATRFSFERERCDFIGKVVACVSAHDEPMGAFACLGRLDGTANGAVYDALGSFYRRFDRHVSALLHSCALAERWNGPVAVPSIVAVGYGEAPPMLHLAVPTIGLEPYTLALVALLEDGFPRRAPSGAIDWFTLPWHRIQAVVSTDPAFAPEVSAGRSFVAGLLARPPTPLQSIVQRGNHSASRLLEAATMGEFFEALLADEDDEQSTPSGPIGKAPPCVPDNPEGALQAFDLGSQMDHAVALGQSAIFKRFVDAMDQPVAALAPPPAIAVGPLKKTTKTRRGPRRRNP